MIATAYWKHLYCSFTVVFTDGLETYYHVKKIKKNLLYLLFLIKEGVFITFQWDDT
jgi:hypothetical protein